MKKLLTVTLLSVSALFASTTVALAQSAAQSYIEKFKDNAIRIMHETGVPASIILGVAMHESASGKSAIAQNLNNQFGVKGGGGAVYYKGNKKVRSAYKKYDNVMASFQDFARIMTERKQFSHLADKLTQYDYKGWAKGIQRGGYASSKKWSAQVLGIINKYDLNDFDDDAEANPAKDELADNN
ncbi:MULTISPECIES: glucosaminidase domain-containing protein [unclassified Mucilaginibacter]|uniref:glucosaminidase domain-containing protein n=1 Tax=unclassified Mucilaginibacter TaxID=2617802 RepID=UPI002AC9BB61|nr:MULTISPECIES: glucosaminidase domain-containing protein [unclassified Mucilaginibacter]MEB0261699.1 glucosaminidase domain-containing protein [Mucilaginibacter sp. 10I4]MEB0278349.1 glucosaminidase domain-containing protein [Mucilaginibacter sp. 10B2]MEB0301030.1 glucosaminidase domain-containing protein [Mucilaginibacter sp. 5C4]WPX23994.1 glucosaminidase domain-containing protein [Mucilaginibacter sp. 5C4]